MPVTHTVPVASSRPAASPTVRARCGSDRRLREPVVANAGNSSLTVYGPGNTGNATPKATVAGSLTGLRAPAALTVTPSGTILVANPSTNSITGYSPIAPGNVAPVRTITGSATTLATPDGIDVDTLGNIYVSDRATNSIIEFAAAATGNAAPLTTITGALTGLASPGRLAVAPPLAILTTRLPAASRGRAYHAQLQAALGTTPYHWNTIRGHLPPDLRLRRSTGAISGTPRRSGTFRFLIKITDSTQPRMTATRWLRITVARARTHNRPSSTARQHHHRETLTAPEASHFPRPAR